MDFGDGQNALKDAESGANATHTQIGQDLHRLVVDAAVEHDRADADRPARTDDNEFFSQANAGYPGEFRQV